MPLGIRPWRRRESVSMIARIAANIAVEEPTGRPLELIFIKL
jgi:hypothetical protein